MRIRRSDMKRNPFFPLQLVLLVLLWPGILGAQDVELMKDPEIKNKTFEKFSGINFGLGVGVVGIPSDRLAKNAQVVNSVVRVDDQTNQTASIVLESHYFFTDKDRPRFGHGP